MNKFIFLFLIYYFLSYPAILAEEIMLTDWTENNNAWIYSEDPRFEVRISKALSQTDRILDINTILGKGIDSAIHDIELFGIIYLHPDHQYLKEGMKIKLLSNTIQAVNKTNPHYTLGIHLQGVVYKSLPLSTHYVHPQFIRSNNPDKPIYRTNFQLQGFIVNNHNIQPGQYSFINNLKIIIDAPSVDEIVRE